MSFLHRLPPDFRRRYYINVAVVVMLVLFVFNVGRLGPKNGAAAILALVALGAAYIAVWPLVCVVRARPRPPFALALAGTNCAALAYVLASAFLRLPGVLLGLVLATLCLWTLLIAYRRIMLPSLFARSGGFSERWKTIREAQRASRAESETLFPPK